MPTSGHANFVDGFWSSGRDRSGDLNLAAQRNPEKLQNQAGTVEGCSDVGWMRMDMAFFMDTHFYAGMSGSVDQMWPFFYECPPAIVPNSKLILLIQIQNLARRR
jgi:hypothetical protein